MSLYSLANAIKYLSAAGATETQHITLRYGGLTSEHDQQYELSALDELDKNENYEYGQGYTELLGSLFTFMAGGILFYQLLYSRKNKPSN